MNRSARGEDEFGMDEGPHPEGDRRRKRKREDDEFAMIGAAAVTAEGGGDGEEEEEEDDNAMDSEMYYKIRKMYAEGLGKTVFSENVMEKGEKYVLSDQARSAIADLALDFSRMLAVDAISFAHHAKRSRIAIDDVKLFCRRNPSTKKALDEVIASFTSGAAGATSTTGSGAPSPNVSKKSSSTSSSSSSSSSSAATSRKSVQSNPQRKKEGKGSAITVNSPPPQQQQQQQEQQSPMPLPVAKSAKGQRAQKSGNTSPAGQGKQPSTGLSTNNESSYFGARPRGSPNVGSNRAATSVTNTSNSTTSSTNSSKNGIYIDDDDDFLLEGLGDIF